MADSQAARRYAQAAFAIASEAGTLDLWRDQLEDVASVLAESDAAPLLDDARIPLDDRLALVDRVLDVDPLVLNLARLLVAKGRSPEARAVAEHFGKMVDEQQGLAQATLTTAIELTPEQVAAIEQRLSDALQSRVRATARVDPGLLGGIVIRIGDRLFDGSVRTRLKSLRRELEQAG